MGAFSGMLSATTKNIGVGYRAGSEVSKSYADENEFRREVGIADAAAVDDVNRGEIAAGRTRMAGSQTLFKQGVAYSASGIDASVGTPASVAGGSSLFNELDAMTLENNATRAAWGHKELARKYNRAANGEAGKRTAIEFGAGLEGIGNVLGAAGGGASGGSMMGGGAETDSDPSGGEW